MTPDAGKGDKRRPLDKRYCTLAQWYERCDKVFGKKPGATEKAVVDQWKKLADESRG